MVQSNAVTRFDTVVAVMTADEARACVTRINTHMNSARLELLRLYEGRGWQALGYASWRECVVIEFDQAQRTLYKQLEAAQIEQRIAPMGQIGAIPERQLRPLSALTPMEQPLAWQEANERSEGKPTARIVEEVVREMRDGPSVAEIATDIDDVLDPPMEPAQAADVSRAPRINAGLFSSATPEWYTPRHIIEKAIEVLGAIDLDPCSNSNDPDLANVPAGSYWTQADNGLVQLWEGRVYMNPPYGDEIGVWVECLIEHFKAGNVKAAIALLPARIDTAWFQLLSHYPFCAVKGRLKFSGSANSAPFPSAIVYLGSDVARFIEVFDAVGPVYRRCTRAE